jgi:hypothetical protein
MNKIKLFVAVVVLFTGVVTLKSHGQEDKVKDLMKRKLGHSQKVLEGIAINDFEMIGNNAQEMILISKTAEWQVLKTPEYELYSNEFRRSAGELVEKSRAKNIDGATLAYVDLTLTCVKCHKHVRETRMTRREPLDRGDRRVELGK